MKLENQKPLHGNGVIKSICNLFIRVHPTMKMPKESVYVHLLQHRYSKLILLC